ncbi:hypothetical protein T265_12360 [Opisthorchis viverrini]|uniref:Uncharacterized protein n=1 Tax=Opisthorchis viverrini TaxID=6198 RepID=A0A074YTM4_OPIVI|nr:hypothetical protein T265_12360 [Opisthorchis viverrini]KER18141.1 hypothetical protein T265_12360 [Opisthorchis viverrini]
MEESFVLRNGRTMHRLTQSTERKQPTVSETTNHTESIATNSRNLEKQTRHLERHFSWPHAAVNASELDVDINYPTGEEISVLERAEEPHSDGLSSVAFRARGTTVTIRLTEVLRYLKQGKMPL